MESKIVELLKLMRPQQWYKNLIIFLPLIFTFNLFDTNLFLITLAGFAALCLVSSSSYIINDIKDRKVDAQHPEKKYRAIASGKIKAFSAGIFALILVIVALWISYVLKKEFLIFVIALFVLTQLYTFWLKKEAFADIILISTNFVIRAVSGVALISVDLGPWIIVSMFFLAAFLAIGKRKSDLELLKKKAEKTRKVLQIYTSSTLDTLLTITLTCLILTYALFVSISQYRALFITLPFLVYCVFVYYHLIQTNSKIARHPELFLKEKRLMVGIALYLILTLVLLYVM